MSQSGWTRLNAFHSSSPQERSGAVTDFTNFEDAPSDNDANNESYTHRGYVLLCALLIHGLPVVFTIIVITLCVQEQFFAEETRPNINAIISSFQFVATVHGYIIVMSLGALSAYHLQYEVRDKNGVSLGLWEYTHRLSSPEILFTGRFWGTLTSASNNRRTYVFGLGILVATVIAALANPTSAVLVVPQTDWWDVKDPFGTTNGFSYLNLAHDQLWPDHVHDDIIPKECVEAGGFTPLNCPFANVGAISKWAGDYLAQYTYPNISTLCEANIIRYLSASDYNNLGYAAASTGMNHISRSLRDVWEYVGRKEQASQIPLSRIGRPMITLSSADPQRPIRRPLVQTQCGMAQAIPDEHDEMDVNFPVDQLVSKPDQHFTPNVSRRISVTRFRDRSPIVDFIDLSAEARQPTLGAIIGMSFHHAKVLFGSGRAEENGTGIIGCRFAVHWISTDMSTDPTRGGIAVLDVPSPIDVVNSTTLMASSTPVNVDLSYANRTNARIPSTSISVLEYELSRLSFRHPKDRFDMFAGRGNWTDRWSYIVATILSMQLADALARLKTRVPIEILCNGCPQGNSSSKIQSLARQNNADSAAGTNESALVLAEKIKAHSDQYTPVSWTVHRYGYGWSLRDMTKILSAVLLLLHCFLVLVHFVVVAKRSWQYENQYRESRNSILGWLNLAAKYTDLSVDYNEYRTFVRIRNDELRGN